MTTHSALHADEAKAAFVRDVTRRARLPTYATAESVATAVMCILTERLTSGGAHVLLEALPEHIRALFERCVEHRKGPVRQFDRADLIELTADHLGITPQHAEEICRAVLGAVRARIPADVAQHVGAQLPADLKALWFAPLAPAAEVAASDDELERARLNIYARIEQSGALPPGIDGAKAFMAVMCIFSQRLSGGEARHLLLALPNTIRPLVGTCMLHRDELAAPFGQQEFIRRVAEHLETTTMRADTLVRAVFAAVKHWLPRKEVEDVGAQLPTDLRTLWLEC